MARVTPRRTARTTKVETLPDEERMFVIGMIDARQTGQAISDAYAERFQKHLAPSTIYSYIERRWLPNKVAAEQAIAEAREFADLERSNPDIPHDVLLRGWLARKLSSPAFQDATLDANQLLGARLAQARLDLQQREIEGKEESNKLKRQSLELDRRRVELLERKLPKVKDELEKVIKDEKATKADLQRELRRIYGLVGESAETPGSAAPLSGPLGG